MKKLCIICLVIFTLSSCNLKSDKFYSISDIDEFSLDTRTDTKSSDTDEDIRVDESLLDVNTDIESSNTTEDITFDGLSLLGKYDGNWYIDGLIAWFFPPESKSTNLNNDRYLNSEINIDIKNNKVTFNGDDTYKFLHVSEFSSDELSHVLFAPKWSIMAKEMAREICGGVYNKETNRFSEGNTVKFIRFENVPKESKYSDFLTFIISDNGNLLVFIGEVVGTYTLSRK